MTLSTILSEEREEVWVFWAGFARPEHPHPDLLKNYPFQELNIQTFFEGIRQTG